MAWVYLLMAGLFEVGYASTMKLTEGFTKVWPTVFFGFCIVTSFFLLTHAVREIPIGTAYASGEELARRGLPSSASSSIRNL
jgi:quaternary ammonium compound-resistance protein SugE